MQRPRTRPLAGSFAWLALAALFVCACAREESRSTPLPTRQTTIDPVMKKLDSADQEAQKRREALESTAK